MELKKTSVVIDKDLLEAAKEALGTRTLRDTIDQALREVLRLRARREEIASLSQMKGLDLADDEVMAGAWRH